MSELTDPPFDYRCPMCDALVTRSHRASDITKNHEIYRCTNCDRAVGYRQYDEDGSNDYLTLSREQVIAENRWCYEQQKQLYHEEYDKYIAQGHSPEQARIAAGVALMFFWSSHNSDGLEYEDI